MRQNSARRPLLEGMNKLSILAKLDPSRLFKSADRGRGKAAGTGATIGATLGSAAGGPVGAAVGGAVGAMLGVLVSELKKK